MVVCAQCGAESPEGFRFCGACGAAVVEAAAPRQARKVVTALFCDVTGSTALGEELDPEVLRGVLNRYFAEMRSIIERHGGTVEKFIGDAVMAVFGIPTLHEDDALRAVRAAAEIRARLPEIAQEVQVELRFRTGVNTGPVLMGEGENLAIGDAVNVAARLEQAAEPGQIVIGEETLALVRDAVEVEVLEPLELKGKSEPVRAYRLASVDSAASGFARHLDVPLVGRRPELALLRQAWDRVLDHSGCHLVTLLGEAGVGKSRLVSELLARIGADATVLRGRCLHYGEGITFWPLVEALMPVAGPAQDVLDRLSGGGVATPGELFWEVRRLLESLAAQRPVVLHVDDLQWAEPTLLDLLDYLRELSREAAILLLCVARPELLEERPGWGAGEANATTLVLEPLTAGDAEALLGELGAGLDADARARVITASEGNPLFLEEMVALAQERGTVETPPTIQALLTARLERLRAPERELLERGAVEGEVFHRLAVRALAGESLAPEVERWLAGLVRKQLIRPHPATLSGDEAFRFRHLLIRDAAYESLPKATRAELHERFARWLEENATGLLEVDEITGWHLEQAVAYARQLARPVNARLVQDAAVHLAAAGDRAFARSDMAAAANLHNRAAALLPEGDLVRPELLIEAASALTEIGDLSEARSTYERGLAEAQNAGSERAQWRARIGLANVSMWMGGSFTDALETSERAAQELTRLGDELGLARAWTVAGNAYLQAGRSRDGELALGRAIEHAQRAHSRREEAQAVTWLLITAWMGPTPVEEALVRCADLAADQVSRQIEAFALIEQAPLRAMRGEFDTARRLFREGRAILDELGLKIYSAGVSQEYFDIETLAGDLQAAEADLRHACEALARFGEKGFLSTRAACLAHALCLQGRSEEAEALIELAVDSSGPDDLATQMLSLTARARLSASRGNAEEAIRFAEEAVSLLRSTDLLCAHADALVILADALRLANRSAEAATALDGAVRLYRQKGNQVAAARTTAALNELRTALIAPQT